MWTVNFKYDWDSLGRVEDKKMYGSIVDAYGGTETTVKVYKTAQSEVTATLFMHENLYPVRSTPFFLLETHEPIQKCSPAPAKPGQSGE